MSLLNNVTNRVPLKAAIAASSSGATQVVAAVTGRKIRVLSYLLIASGAVNFKWQSGTNDLSGLKNLVANSGAAYSEADDGVIETNAGEALNINLSAAVAVGGELTYKVIS